MKRLTKLSPIHHAEEKWQGQFEEQAGWQVVQWFSSVEKEMAVARNAVALCDQTHRGKLRIEGRAAGAMLTSEDLAVNAGKKSRYGFLYRLRSDLFFAWTEADGEAAALREFNEMANEADSLVTVTNMTQGSAELWLIGPNSSRLLSRLCSLDLHDSQFPNGTAKQSSVAKTSQLLVRQDMSKIPAYALIGARSLTSYVWQTLFEVGKDLDLDLIGQKAFEQLTNEK